MTRAIGMYEHSELGALSYHHHVTTGHPGGREICNAGWQSTEDGRQGECGRTLVLGAKTTCLGIAVEFNHDGAICTLLPCNQLLFFPNNNNNNNDKSR